MPEDQFAAMPMDVRQMVMTGTTAMMAAAAGQNPGAAAAMMAAGVGMNHPMMDINTAMNMSAAMGMGMNGGDMGGMPMQPSPSTAATMMQEAAASAAAGPGQGGPVTAGTGSAGGGAGTPSEQGVQMGMGGADGYVGQGVVQPSPAMMGVGMGGGEFGMQVCVCVSASWGAFGSSYVSLPGSGGQCHVPSHVSWNGSQLDSCSFCCCCCWRTRWGSWRNVRSRSTSCTWPPRSRWLSNKGKRERRDVPGRWCVY
jgi:hypothetical protein